MTVATTAHNDTRVISEIRGPGSEFILRKSSNLESDNYLVSMQYPYQGVPKAIALCFDLSIPKMQIPGCSPMSVSIDSLVDGKTENLKNNHLVRNGINKLIEPGAEEVCQLVDSLRAQGAQGDTKDLFSQAKIQEIRRTFSRNIQGEDSQFGMNNDAFRYILHYMNTHPLGADTLLTLLKGVLQDRSVTLKQAQMSIVTTLGDTCRGIIQSERLEALITMAEFIRANRHDSLDSASVKA